MTLSSTLFKKKKNPQITKKITRDAGCLPTIAFFSSFLYVFLNDPLLKHSRLQGLLLPLRVGGGRKIAQCPNVLVLVFGLFFSPPGSSVLLWFAFQIISSLR